MNPYAATIRIHAPPEKIWPIVADVMQWPQWLPTMTSVDNINGTTLAVGHQYRLEQPGFRPTVWTVVELEPLRTFSWVARWPGASALAGHTVRPASDGHSDVTLQVHFSGPFSFLARALGGRRINEYLALEAASLKRQVEMQK